MKTPAPALQPPLLLGSVGANIVVGVVVNIDWYCVFVTRLSLQDIMENTCILYACREALNVRRDMRCSSASITCARLFVYIT